MNRQTILVSNDTLIIKYMNRQTTLVSTDQLCENATTFETGISTWTTSSSETAIPPLLAALQECRKAPFLDLCSSRFLQYQPVN